jgi:hypothetical protein
VDLKSVKNKPSSNFNPSLHQNKFYKIFYPLSVVFALLVLYDAISVQTFYDDVVE